jgi:hypothetical protein
MKHKEYYNDHYILELSKKILSLMSSLDEKTFSNDLIGQLDDKELFEGFDFIVDALEKSMGNDYSKNIQVFSNMLGPELTRPE